MSLSALVRHAVEGTRPMKRNRVEVDPALVRQLAQIGNNLNQLARWANRDKRAVEALAVIARLVEIEREIVALRHSIEKVPDAD
ncbi:mobilization protein MobC [Phyllobacterium leguminum]|uniref:Mobilization protein MobC n=2 Tax=Phyllobacterium leguminum TaxID=314237 RepID=A0A318SV30_9HYPH|nr:plasmid mobilization relaxosome protein MobC [Phyllobacterium leguminum]PYE84199.1 mobilization protein MobC [Phyllobacterium leguminum]